MTVPMVSEVFSDWTQMLQVQIVNTIVADYEVHENALTLLDFEGIFEPMPDTKLINKPEGQRQWQWWTLWTTYDLKIDAIIQDASGLQYRVMTRAKWDMVGGYRAYEIAQDPVLNS